MSDDAPTLSVFRRLVRPRLPKMPDFFHAAHRPVPAGRPYRRALVEFMESGDPATGQMIRRDEHEADKIKVHNPHTLNEAFQPDRPRRPVSRHHRPRRSRQYCKTTVSEMDVLALTPDKHCLEMAMHIARQRRALALLSRLAKTPREAAADADAARKAERKVEKAYRRAIAELFQGDDYIHMFKRREIYRHLERRRPHGQLRQYPARHRRQDDLRPTMHLARSPFKPRLDP